MADPVPDTIMEAVVLAAANPERGRVSVNEQAPEVTLEGIRYMLGTLRRRKILFFHGDDREVVTTVCRTLRGEGYELAERENSWVEPGRVIVVDADVLQSKYPMIDGLFR